MYIHWFPGHMAKALKELKAQLPLVDCFIYVLDARAPFTCQNPVFDDLIAHKRILYVLSKTDLISNEDKLRFVEAFSQNKNLCVAVNSTDRISARLIVNALYKLNAEKIQKNMTKHVIKPIRAMVVGVPNSGKSTLINNLVGSKKTKTANIPGVTKSKQWVKVDDSLEVLDSPGILYPDFENQDKAFKLALLGSVKDEIVEQDILAQKAVEFFCVHYPQKIIERYQITSNSDSPQDIISEIAKNKGLLLRGGGLDLLRASKMLINDFRSGKLGTVNLDVESLNNE